MLEAPVERAYLLLGPNNCIICCSRSEVLWLRNDLEEEEERVKEEEVK